MKDAGRIGFVIKGDYDRTATYEFLDVVYFGNSSYVAKKTTNGNEPENDNEYWHILANTPDNSVTGIKGAAETAFRGGNVNLTPENIGALPIDGTAKTADKPTGFASRESSASWGNQTGECITCLNDDAAGSLQFRKNNPENGQLSALIDGYFYQREGMKRCLDEEDKKPEHIGNNGTGGISVGTGLLTSSENVYNVLLEPVTLNRAGSVYEEELEGDTYFAVDYSTNNLAAQSFLVNYMDMNTDDILAGVSPGFSISFNNDNFVEFFMVTSPATITAYYTDSGMAENNSPSDCSIGARELTGTKKPLLNLFGSYNRNSNYEPGYGSLFEVGNGTAAGRANAMRLNRQNRMYLGSGGAYNSSGADHAEFIKPWADGNPGNEDRVGYLVTIKDGLLYKAEADDYIVGITSGNPCLVGNADEDYYWKYERDEFNRIVMEDVPEEIPMTDDSGNPVFDEETGEPVMMKTGRMVKERKIAEGYDPAQSYVERKDRREWDYVGMLGVLPVRDDGTCLPGQFCKCGKDGIATLAEEKDFNSYMVIERISEYVVSVLLR